MPGQTCQKSDWDSHKRTCQRQNYLLRVELCPGDIVDPPIMRTLSCPAKATFDELHQALQVAFGWASTHCYDFKIQNANSSCLLRIVNSPDEDDPFSGGGVDSMFSSMRTDAWTPEKMSSTIQLHHVFENAQYRGLPLEYEYDFGDCWEHAITLVGRKEATEFFMCTDGEGHGCAEDVGSSMGWEELKEAYRASHPTREQREHMTWFETMASNSDAGGLGGGRDRVWAKGKINRDLADLSGQTFSFT